MCGARATDPERRVTAQALGEVAIVGGGIAGLAAAHYLSRAGASVTLFEGSNELGGLGRTFEHEGVHLERFYHCMLPSDRHLISLLEDLGIAGGLYWRETSFGVHAQGRIYPLNRPVDLLKFGALPVRDRLRLGLTGLYARHADPRGLDDVTCEDWLCRLSGTRAFQTFWKPMLEAKFGVRYHEVPALWFWTRLNREKGEAVEHKGYIHGGYRRIVDSLVDSLRQGGHRLSLNSPVKTLKLDSQGRPEIRLEDGNRQIFDRLLFAAPFALFRKVADLDGSVAPAGGDLEDVDMIGVLNVVLTLRESLTPHYWVAVPQEDIAFQGVVENTNLIDPSDTAGLHVLHLLRYTHRNEPLYGLPDDQVLDTYLEGFHRLFPKAALPEDAGRFVFRTPFVEPVYTTGYLRKQPPMELVSGRLYLATSAQVYPEVTSWNGSVGLARKTVDLMLRAIGKS